MFGKNKTDIKVDLINMNKTRGEFNEIKYAELVDDLNDDLTQKELRELINMDEEEHKRLLKLLEKEEAGEEAIPGEDTIDNILKRKEAKYQINKGDIWQLGNHRLMCGDSTEEGKLGDLMDNTPVDLLLTDPPYGVSYSEKNQFLNSIDKGNKVQENIVNDEIKDMNTFLTESLEKIKPLMAETSAAYIFFAGKTLRYLLNSLDKLDFKLHQILAWVKNNHVLGRTDYASKHELIVYGWFNKHKFYGCFSPSTLEFDKPLKSDLHPTMKPIDLLEYITKNSSEENMVVLDPFAGSGSTLIACENSKRKCYTMEIDPFYCSVIIERWEKYTNKKAKLVNKE